MFTCEGDGFVCFGFGDVFRVCSGDRVAVGVDLQHELCGGCWWVVEDGDEDLLDEVHDGVVVVVQDDVEASRGAGAGTVLFEYVAVGVCLVAHGVFGSGALECCVLEFFGV